MSRWPTPNASPGSPRSKTSRPPRPPPRRYWLPSSTPPAAQGVATYAALRRVAETAHAAGDPRTRGQVMADTLTTRITGQTTAEAVPVCINLVLDADTLLGPNTSGGTADLTAPGAGSQGPIPAAIAAHILGAAPDHGRWLRRLYTRPHTRQLITADSRRRCFPTGLARLIALTQPTCRTPWCDAPTAHIDHITSHTHGGPTTLTNAQGLCQTCNLAKALPDWHAHPLPASTGPPTTITTTTPTGHTYDSGPAG